MVSVTIDDSSLSSEDLDQIVLVDNFLNHVSQMLATKTESMNMFVGTEIVGNMRVSDRDNMSFSVPTRRRMSSLRRNLRKLTQYLWISVDIVSSMIFRHGYS